MPSFTSSHNKKLLNSHTEHSKPCNCRKKDKYPLNGQCPVQDIVYKCVASTSMNPDKTYRRTAEGDLKKRCNNHTKPFRHKRYSKETTLSKHIWDIKKKYNEMPMLKWSVVTFVPPYSNISKKCLLCFHKNLEIVNLKTKITC